MAITLRLHHFLVEEAPVHQKVLLPLARKIERESQGELRIEVHHGMRLGGAPTDLFDQARDGVVDIAWVMPGYSLGRFSRLEVFELPFIMSDRVSTSLAAWDFAQRHALDELQGVKLLSVHVLGAGGFHGMHGPVRRLEDFRGLRLRAPTQRTFDFARALGAQAVMCTPAEMRRRMLAGELDSAMLNWDFAGSTRTIEIARYNTETDAAQAGVYTSVILLVMNPQRFNTLPEAARAVLDANSGPALGRWIGDAMAGGEDFWRARAIALGNEVNSIAADELERWQDAAHTATQAWLAEMHRRGLDGESMLLDARGAVTLHTGRTMPGAMLHHHLPEAPAS